LSLPPFVRVVDFVKCTGTEHIYYTEDLKFEGPKHLEEFSSSVVAKNGEGVVLREHGSMYKAGRSPSLRKYKPFSDTEVKVIKNQYPIGFTCQQ
jgi:ATP-dependent DNA ligase